MYLEQLLEEYQESDNKEVKEEIFKQFIERLWRSKYRLTKYKKKYQFKINEKALNYRDDLIELFKKYQDIECDFVKSSFRKVSIEPIDYIRIRINNLYAIYFDKEVYYDKEYYEFLGTAKKEYYATVDKLKKGDLVSADDIEEKIKSSLKQAEFIKNKNINRKLELKWSEYKKLINEFLRKIFDNYITIEEYESKYGWELKVSVDGWNEDHFVVRYFCKSLSGYMRDFKREMLGFRKTDKLKTCKICGRLFKVTGRNHHMCVDCKFIKEKENNKRYARESMRRKRKKLKS